MGVQITGSHYSARWEGARFVGPAVGKMMTLGRTIACKDLLSVIIPLTAAFYVRAHLPFSSGLCSFSRLPEFRKVPFNPTPSHFIQAQQCSSGGEGVVIAYVLFIFIFCVLLYAGIL